MSKVSTTSVSSTISAPSRQREPADSLVWNAISLRKQNHARLSEELADETNSIIRLIKELATLKALSNEREVTIIKTLDDYKNCRLSEKNSLRNTLSDNAWEELESFGLPYDSRIFEKQLNHCYTYHKENLRKMILSRMESFRSIAKQIETKNILEQETEIESTENSKREIIMLNQNNVVDAEWRDNDKNNSIQLVKDIENLNRALNKAIGVKRNVKEIKKEAVAELFNSYNCTTNVNKKQMKLVLDAVLQRHLIKNIWDSADYYFTGVQKNDNSEYYSTGSQKNDNLEAAIRSKTEELINLTSQFENTNLEIDENAQTLPTILRQQNYATLGHRVFSKNHPFVNQLVNYLTKEMNRYRILDSEEKNKKFEDDIITILIQFLRIFYFRLKTQEPTPSVKFYESGTNIDPFYMDGMWEGHYEDYVVEICSFPAIIVESDERAYIKAQVIARPKEEFHEDEESDY
ncbi:hypothetical protein GLOIN_2v1779292 [Rhizophagus irregularis DAOM 181602=DAOM 197198]|nr:hypothetical protein GLOIN_2v1779292 [Rhizophagus irregularis DAOM 181602=DAOM 197198]